MVVRFARLVAIVPMNHHPIRYQQWSADIRVVDLVHSLEYVGLDQTSPGIHQLLILGMLIADIDRQVQG